MSKQRTPLLRANRPSISQEAAAATTLPKPKTPVRTVSTPPASTQQNPNVKTQKPFTISSNFVEIARGIGDQSTPVHYVIVVMDISAEPIVIPLEQVMGPKCGSYFTSFGIALDKEEIAKIRDFARNTGPEDIKYDIQTRVGFNGSRFGFPFLKGNHNECKAKGKRKWLLLFSSNDLLTDYKMRGSFDDWRKLAEFAKGNSRLIFLFALALAAPLSGLLGHVPLTFILYGEQGGAGKTSLAAIASSVWGWNSDDFGFGQSCNVTPIGLQSFLASRRHALAVIDEPATNEDRKKCAQLLLGLAFQVASGAGRVRQRQDYGGQVERTEPMETAVIITSNNKVEEIVRWTGSTVGSQHHDRMITIAAPIDAEDGFLETLHGHASLSALIGTLKKIARVNHGVAGQKFLQNLEAAWVRDSAKFEAFAQTFERKYLEACSEFAGDDSLQRLNRSFARVYVAGVAGIKTGVLCLKEEELLAALLKCHLDCLPFRTAPAVRNNTALDAERLLATLSHFWADNCEALPTLNDGSFSKLNPPPYNQAFISDEKSRRYLALTNEYFVELCGGKHSANALKVLLVAKGLLLREKAGKDSARNVVKRQVGVGIEHRFVLISVEAFDDSVEDF